MTFEKDFTLFFKILLLLLLDKNIKCIGDRPVQVIVLEPHG